jgi:hypothetical protein
MLAYAQILYGVALTAGGVTVLTLLVPRWRRVALVLTAVVVAPLAVLAWQFVLRATHASQFFTDLPFRLFPISWQDTGSGVAAFALTALVLAYGPLVGDGGRPSSQVDDGTLAVPARGVAAGPTPGQ